MNALKPSGPFAIGTVTRRLEDPDRGARRLFLKVWYPADAPAGAIPELLWAQLRGAGATPWPVRALLGLLRRRSCSVPGAPQASAAGRGTPVLYNHGLVSFASENTSLAEELASHGHPVVAIEHVDQLAEYRGLQRAGTKDPIDQLVRERAADTAFVLDRLDSILAAVPGSAAPAEARAHLVGFSLGGAVSAELAAHDGRVASVVNLDGGTQGSGRTREVPTPYLMLYSEANEGINDAALPPQAQRLSAPRTRHLNYHDLAAVLPLLRWTAALGAAQPAQTLRWRNEKVREFLAQDRTAAESFPG
jgi:dienelactone hydrolase